MISLRTSSVDDTRAVGTALAGVVRPGDVVVLGGDLGAGKTALVQGFGRGLGVEERITSPTFTLASTYTGRLRMHHLDVYRLDHLQEVEDIGIAELVDDGSVTLVEWGDVVTASLPAEYLEVRLAFAEGDDERVLQVRPVGPRWQQRAGTLRQALADFTPAEPPC